MFLPERLVMLVITPRLAHQPDRRNGLRAARQRVLKTRVADLLFDCRYHQSTFFSVAVPLISDAPDRADAFAFRVAEQLPQAHDHVVHRALIEKLVLSPQLIENLIATDDARTAGDQQLQQFKVARGWTFTPAIRLDDHASLQFNYAAVTGDAPAHWMTVEHVLDAQQQFLQMKRLGNEFFRANFESFQTVFGGAERRHEHHGQRGAPFDVSGQLETRAVRQADVENHQIPKALAQLFQRSLFGFDPRHVIFFAQQAFAQGCAQRAIIFDQQQSLHNWYARFQRANSPKARQRRAYPRRQANPIRRQSRRRLRSEN